MKNIILLFILLLFFSCTKAPNCHDERVKKTVLKLAPELVAEKFETALPIINPGFSFISIFAGDELRKAIDKSVKEFSFSIRNTRIDSYNSNIDKYICSAELVMRHKDNPNEDLVIHIVYTSQLADNGKNFYVTLKLSEEEEIKFFQELLKFQSLY